jgi:hypothetical protein
MRQRIQTRLVGGRNENEDADLFPTTQSVIFNGKINFLQCIHTADKREILILQKKMSPLYRLEMDRKINIEIYLVVV